MLSEVDIASVSYDDGRFQVVLDDQTLDAEKLLVAAGRRPNLGDLGLDTVGLDPSARARGRRPMRAGEGLWALGDVTGKGAFTHTSMYQSAICVRDILGQDGPTADYRALPRVTFTDPEVGSVGMTEKQARDAGFDVRVAHAELAAASTRGWIARAPGLIKLVEDADRGVLVGATTVGPSGGEMLSMLTTAIHAEIPTDTLRSMIYPYPTYHRGIEYVLGQLA